MPVGDVQPAAAWRLSSELESVRLSWICGCVCPGIGRRKSAQCAGMWSVVCDGMALEIRNLLAKWLGKEEEAGWELVVGAARGAARVTGGRGWLGP